MNKLPRHLKVGGYVYDVHYPAKFIENSNLLGLHQAENNAILIAGKKTQSGEKRPWSRIEQVFWHELLHAVDATYNPVERLDEATLSRLAEGLYQVLNDNFKIRSK